MGKDGAGFFCPGSSGVAEADDKCRARFFQGRMTSSARRSRLSPDRSPYPD